VSTGRLRTLSRELGALDRAVYAAVAGQDSPTLDRPLRLLTGAADHAKLWVGLAGVLALAGGRPGRRAARDGLVAVGVASAAVNLVAKGLRRRTRPDREALDPRPGRWVPMPTSSSFPSGHSASAFAFASAVGADLPWLALPLRSLATAVAYSRVHTGVHYPGDTLAGAVIGTATGQSVSRLAAGRAGPG
jgi:undecaprenyl-diphosphatase